MNTGPGEPDCPKCHGRGVTLEAGDGMSDRGTHPPRFRRCECVLQKDISANVERGMRKLMKAPAIPESPLLNNTDEDLWITASKPWFTANLRHVAIRQPPTWHFKVVTDADLMTSWLASVALKGKDILDPDAAKVSMTYITLVDLIMPPQLLVVRLGVKQARNVASPEVLLETLRLREHAGLPTWVWDTPREMLAEGHICWSVLVAEYLSVWRHLRTRDVAPAPPPTRKAEPVANPHAEWAGRPDRESDVDPDDYEDKDYVEPGESGSLESLKGGSGHVDLSLPSTGGAPTLGGGGRKTLWGKGGDE